MRSSLGRFTCNVCGSANNSQADLEDREQASCASCGSSMRFRTVLLALSRAVFGTELCLCDFPRLKSVRGMGISDSEVYCYGLEDRFSYLNTFYHQAPRFDLVEPDETEFGKYDFVICSEVLEHVAPPVDRAFRTLAGLLKPSGVLILTIPFSLNTHTIEHFRTKGSLGLAELDGKTVAVGRSNDGSYEVFDNLVFHGGHGSTLEMRLFSEAGLRTNLADCGLTNVRFESKGSEKFGVHFSGPCSLPIVAGRQPFSLDVAGIAELTEQLVTAQRALKESRWLQLGRRLGLGPRIREPKV